MRQPPGSPGPRPPIRRLDEHTANQIAAGEVVERPASVVKELVENSLDAGARRIAVRIEGAGLMRIEVQDDGWGIPAEELPAALERHATSKIRTALDLHRVASLGFRGEALPSIASVSRLTVESRVAEQESGQRLAVEGGRVTTCEPCPMPPGTRVTVCDLFYNTPARRKFLRLPATERAQVIDRVAQLALAEPAVAISLESDGREIFVTPGDGDLRNAVAAVYGPDLARDLLPLGAGELAGDVAVQGLIGLPSQARPSRNLQFFIVNGRPVRVTSLRYAFEQAYGTLLPERGRYPVGVVHLSLPPEMVDVNVHPTKAEVRLANEAAARSAVYHAVRTALGADRAGNSWAALGADRAGNSRAALGADRAGNSRAALETKARPLPGAGQDSAPVWPAQVDERDPLRWRTGPEVGFPARLTGPGSLAWSAWPARAAEPSPPSGDGPATGGAAPSQATPAEPGLVPEALLASLAGRGLRLIGQFSSSYILVEEASSLWLIDQHAAHERVNYERLAAALPPPMGSGGQGSVLSQRLLVPVVVELGPVERLAFERYRASLAAMGVEAEPFGAGAVIVRTTPLLLGHAVAPDDLASLIRSLSEDDEPAAERDGASVTPQDVGAPSPDSAAAGAEARRLERARRALVACKASIRARQPLRPAEMAALVLDLLDCREPATCPHGRPTFLRFGADELARKFGRTRAPGSRPGSDPGGGARPLDSV